MKLALTGTIGRGGDYSQLAPDSFDRMYEMALRVIKCHLPQISDLEVISGGLPWAEHVAVRLYRAGEANRLRLVLPCEFDAGRSRFSEGTGYFDSFANPGALANLYHRKFEARTCRPSLLEIGDAIDRGADVRVVNGIPASHLLVSNVADAVVTFAFNDGCAKASGCSARLNCDLFGGACSTLGPEGRCFHVDATSWTLTGPFHRHLVKAAA